MTSIKLFLLLQIISSVSAWQPLVRVALQFGGRASSTQLQHQSGDGFDAFRERLEGYYQLSDTLDMQDFEEDDDDIEYDNDWSVDAMQACGDDCEECLIPGDMRALPDFAEDLDVMAFLGIQRAEPILKKSVVDWE